MTTTIRQMNCDPSDVFTVLSDGWLYGLWVVGASRIRAVDPQWPAAGASIEHSVGSWPLLLDDTTTVLSCATNSRLVLRAKAWPAGEAKVELTITPHLNGSTVTISEDVTRGPALLIPLLLREPILRSRNNEALQRLQFLAENRERPRRTTT